MHCDRTVGRKVYLKEQPSEFLVLGGNVSAKGGIIGDDSQQETREWRPTLTVTPVPCPAGKLLTTKVRPTVSYLESFVTELSTIPV